ncbi:MAG: maltodextrin glucosidase [Vibrio gallaecicus]
MLPFLFHSQTLDGVTFENAHLTVLLKTDKPDWESIQVRHEPDNEEYLVDLIKVGEEGRLTIWQGTFPINQDQPVTHYAFKVTSEKSQFWLDGSGIHTRMPGREGHYKFNALNQPPSWIAEQTFYQIFPDRFCNGNPEISVKTGEYKLKDGKVDAVAKPWGSDIGGYNGTSAAEFFGGDLAGIRQKLNYLEELGVSTLYLNPIFCSPSNHKYDTTDYLNVDPHLGSNQEFAELSEDIHQRGMKVVLDAVFNHTSSEHPWLDKLQRTKTGAYLNPESPYSDYYFFNDDKSESYVGWKGIQSLPVLNFDNSEVREYIYDSEDSVIKHWLKPPYNIDGWRFDVIHMLGEGEGAKNNAHYVKAFRSATKQQNPNAYVLGEHFFEATSWLQGDQEDGSMNYYGFAHPIRALLANQDIAYQPINIDMLEFTQWLAESRSKIPWLNQLSQLNQLDSHDTARFITLLGSDVARQKIALMFLMTYVGAPCLYYGTEVGLEGGQDPDNRRSFPWGEEKQSPWFKITQSLVQIRKQNPSLQVGSFVELYCDQETLVFARSLGHEHTISVINLADKEKVVSIPFWKLGIEAGQLKALIGYGLESRDSLNGSTVTNELNVIEGEINLTVGSVESGIFSITSSL